MKRLDNKDIFVEKLYKGTCPFLAMYPCLRRRERSNDVSPEKCQKFEGISECGREKKPLHEIKTL